MFARGSMIRTNRSTRLFVPVSPAEPMIIGTPRRRDASNMAPDRASAMPAGWTKCPPSGRDRYRTIPTGTDQIRLETNADLETAGLDRRETQMPVRTDYAQRPVGGPLMLDGNGHGNSLALTQRREAGIR
jgi:hypothetical protein